jgi:hypothetical protein
MKKQKSLKSLANTAWRLMSEYVRREASDGNEMCACVSCGRYGDWRDFDAGHFIHAGHGGKQNPVSFDHRNVHPQCRFCNRQATSRHRHPGNVTIRYTEYMHKRYGIGITDQLEAIKKQPWFRYAELEEQINILKSRLDNLNG